MKTIPPTLHQDCLPNHTHKVYTSIEIFKGILIVWWLLWQHHHYYLIIHRQKIYWQLKFKVLSEKIRAYHHYSIKSSNMINLNHSFTIFLVSRRIIILLTWSHRGRSNNSYSFSFELLAILIVTVFLPYIVESWK